MEQKPNETENNTSTDWLKYVQPMLGALTLLGAGIGGTLHFILEGRGYPEFQLFVLGLVGLFILCVSLITAFLFSGLIAAWTGTAHRKETVRWKKWLVSIGGFFLVAYFFAYALIIFLMVQNYVNLNKVSLLESIRRDLDQQETVLIAPENPAGLTSEHPLPVAPTSEDP